MFISARKFDLKKAEDMLRKVSQIACYNENFTMIGLFLDIFS